MRGRSTIRPRAEGRCVRVPECPCRRVRRPGNTSACTRPVERVGFRICQCGCDRCAAGPASHLTRHDSKRTGSVRGRRDRSPARLVWCGCLSERRRLRSDWYGFARRRHEAGGTFELRLQGPMRITSTAAPQGWWLKCATIGTSDAADQPYPFAANGPPVCTDRSLLRCDCGSLGQSRGRARQALRDCWVLAFPPNPGQWYVGSRYVKIARPGADGRFRVSALPPGDYSIVALDRFDNAERHDADVLAMLARSAQSVTVFERQRLVRDLSLVQRP